jgi:glycosyltransferase involved in cell wall biosynthesis
MVTVAVNGRFLSQPVTGVQRYALNILKQMDHLLGSEPDFGNLDINVVCDRPPPLPFDYERLRVTVTGGMRGYPWEQFVLPRQPARAFISLCNVGPIYRRNHIVCIHDTNVYDVPDSYSRSFRLTYRAVLPAVARTASRVVTVSSYSRDSLLRHGVAPAGREIIVAPNGYEHVLAWTPSQGGLPDDLTEKPYVLMVGSYAKHKRHEILLAGAERLREAGISIVVAGKPGSIFSDHHLPKSSHIRFLGNVSDNELCWLYRNALALAFPSCHEGFGLPVLEAMALGCPVISSDRASLPEVCGDAAVIISSPRTDDWIKAIVQLRDDQTYRSRLSDAGVGQARRFSWQRSARTFLNLALDVSQARSATGTSGA